MGLNSLPMTVTRQRRGCDLNPGPEIQKYVVTVAADQSFLSFVYSAVLLVSERPCTELFVEPCRPSKRYRVTAASPVGSTEHTCGPTLQTDHIRPSSIFCCGPHCVEQSSCRF